MRIKIIGIEYILWRILPAMSILDVACMLKMCQEAIMSFYTYSLFVSYISEEGLHTIFCGKMEVLSSSPNIH